MASLCNDKGGGKRILFVDGGGVRRTIRLGKMTQKAAQGVRTHVEAILASRLAGQPLERSTALWLGEIADTLHGKLERVGLVAPRRAVRGEDARTVAVLVAEFAKARTDLKSSTARQVAQAAKHMVKFFGASRDICSVTPEDALAFYRAMIAEGHAQNTARRRAGRAKEMFRFAIRKKWLAENPFAEVTVRTGSNPERKKYVPAEWVETLLAQERCLQFRLILALSRYAGLRCPSEHLALSWEDIRWGDGRFEVRSPKTGTRQVPIFPELRPFLEAAHEARDRDCPWVVTFNRGGAERNGASCNWRTRLLRAVLAAGLTPWPKIFHALRASCETDLCERFPLHVVCEWLGNSEAVAKEHYLVVTEDHFRSAAQIPAQSRAGGGGTGQDGTPRKDETPAGNLQNAGPAGVSGAQAVTPRGLEEIENSPEHLEKLPTPGAASGALAALLAILRADPLIVGRLDPLQAAEAAAILTAAAARGQG